MPTVRADCREDRVRAMNRALLESAFEPRLNRRRATRPRPIPRKVLSSDRHVDRDHPAAPFLAVSMGRNSDRERLAKPRQQRNRRGSLTCSWTSPTPCLRSWPNAHVEDQSNSNAAIKRKLAGVTSSAKKPTASYRSALRSAMTVIALAKEEARRVFFSSRDAQPLEIWTAFQQARREWEEILQPALPPIAEELFHSSLASGCV